jgi:chemotaxis protein MotB
MARAIQKGSIIMQAFKTTILITSLAALAGCANWDKSSIASLDKSPICPKTHEWQAWSDVRCNPPEAPKGMADNHTALEKDRQRLADDLAASQRQLADRDRELASLRSENGDSARLASQLSAANSERDRLASRLAAMESGTGDKEKLAAELASAKQRVADLERQLAVRDASLAKAEKDLLKSLQPEISKGTVSVH